MSKMHSLLLIRLTPLGSSPASDHSVTTLWKVSDIRQLDESFSGNFRHRMRPASPTTQFCRLVSQAIQANAQPLR